MNAPISRRELDCPYSARGCENASLHNRKKLSPRPGLCCLAKRTSFAAGGLGGSGVWAVQVKLHAASAKITRQSNLMSASIVDRMPTIEARLIDSRRPMYRNPSMDRKEYKSRAIPPRCPAHSAGSFGARVARIRDYQRLSGKPTVNTVWVQVRRTTI